MTTSRSSAYLRYRERSSLTADSETFFTRDSRIVGYAKAVAALLRQLDHASDARIPIIRAPDLLEMREGGLACAMARRELLDVPGIMERRCHLGDLIVRRGGHVEPAQDQMDARVDSSGRLDDLFDARVRATRHQHDSLRRLERQRQLAQLLGPRCFRDQ